MEAHPIYNLDKWYKFDSVIHSLRGIACVLNEVEKEEGSVENENEKNIPPLPFVRNWLRLFDRASELNMAIYFRSALVQIIIIIEVSIHVMFIC